MTVASAYNRSKQVECEQETFQAEEPKQSSDGNEGRSAGSGGRSFQLGVQVRVRHYRPCKGVWLYPMENGEAF